MSKQRKLQLVQNGQDYEIKNEFCDQEILIDPKDFQSIRLMISFTNPTSKSADGQVPIYQLVQVLEKGMVLEVPNRSCAEGHNLLLDIAVFGPNESLQFSSTAKVESLRKADDGADEITVTLVQFTETDWQQFKSIFSGRQEQIEKFLAAAQGQ